MTNEQHRRRMRGHWTAEQDDAVAALRVAARHAEEAGTADSHSQLRCAVDAARAVGVGWTRIGDALGIASGNAYQRYRKRNTAEEGCRGR